MTLKVRNLQFLTTFTQLTARLKNFLMGWLLVLSLKEGLLECATVFIKSQVILSCMVLCKPTYSSLTFKFSFYVKKVFFGMSFCMIV